MKKIIFAFLLAALLLAAGCTKPTDKIDDLTSTPEATEPHSTSASGEETAAPDSIPATDDELCDYVIKMWQEGRADELYAYAGDEIVSLLDKNAFAEMFDALTDVGGRLLSAELVSKSFTSGHNVYLMTLDFENVTADLSLGLSGTKITAFVRNVYFSKDEFEIKREGYTERYFRFESEDIKLNAVYTYADGIDPRPAVLLIAGSGMSDYNETIGLLTPSADYTPFNENFTGDAKVEIYLDSEVTHHGYSSTEFYKPMPFSEPTLSRFADFLLR